MTHRKCLLKKYLFIYLFLALLGLRFCARAFSSCGKRGPLFIAVCGPLTFAASLVAEHRLQTRRFSSCGSRAQLLRGMWDPPRPGLEPVSPALAGRFSTTAPVGQGSPRKCLLIDSSVSCMTLSYTTFMIIFHSFMALPICNYRKAFTNTICKIDTLPLLSDPVTIFLPGYCSHLLTALPDSTAALPQSVLSSSSS